MLHTHSFIYHRCCIMFFSLYFIFPCQYHSTNAPYSFIHLPPTLYNVFLPALQFPLSVSFHQLSILIHSSFTDVNNPNKWQTSTFTYPTSISILTYSLFVAVLTVNSQNRPTTGNLLLKCWQLIFELSDKQPPPDGKLHLTSRNKITFPIFNF